MDQNAELGWTGRSLEHQGPIRSL